MANITSIWLTLGDSNGSEVLETIQVDLKNAVLPMKVKCIAFYEKNEEGVSHLLESYTAKLEPYTPMGEVLVTETT